MNYWTDQFLSHWYIAEEESRWLQHDPHYVQSHIEQLKRTKFIRHFKSDVQWCLLDQHTHAYPLSRALAIASIADVLRRLVRVCIPTDALSSDEVTYTLIGYQQKQFLRQTPLHCSGRGCRYYYSHHVSARSNSCQDPA